MFGIPVYTILVVLAIIMVADAALLWAIWPHKFHGKTIRRWNMKPYKQITYDDILARNKAGHSKLNHGVRTRRHSRRPNVNAR
jgi:hypothetical protein